MKSPDVRTHYDQRYFAWQSSMGEFAGWANLTKFQAFIKPGYSVLDFGCGGGYLLNNMECTQKTGIEINPAARAQAEAFGINVYEKTGDVPDALADAIISNNALEHTANPLEEVKGLVPKGKPGCVFVFVVPCELITSEYVVDDINQHLYSWGPLSLGNLFKAASLKVEQSWPYLHMWPPQYRLLARYLGRYGFEVACKIYGRLWLSDKRYASKQIRIVARKVA